LAYLYCPRIVEKAIKERGEAGRKGVEI